ncbi:hypothetical protein CNYM01_14026, partial [Colletotrichum nymphaeae SA-01]
MEKKVLQPTLREKEGARVTVIPCGAMIGQEPKLNEILGILDLPFVTIGETGISHLPLPTSVSQLLPALAVAERSSHLYSYVRSVSESRRRRPCFDSRALEDTYLTAHPRTQEHMGEVSSGNWNRRPSWRAGDGPWALGCWGRRLGLGWPPIRGAASRFGRRKSAGDVRDDAAVGCWDLGRHTLTRSLGTSTCTPHNGALSAAIPPIRIGIVEANAALGRAVTLGFKVTATNSSSIPSWSRGGQRRAPLQGFGAALTWRRRPLPVAIVVQMFGDWSGGIVVVVSWSRSAFVKGFERESEIWPDVGTRFMDKEALNLVAPGKMTKQPKHYFPDICGNRKKLISTQIESYPWITEGKEKGKKSLLDPSAINAAMLDAARWIFGPAGGLEDIGAPCHPCRCALATFLVTANQRPPVVIRDLSAQITHGDPAPRLRFSPICRPSLVIGKRERREPRRGRSSLVAGRSRSVGCPVCSRDFLPPPHALPAPRFLLVPHIIAALRKYWHTPHIQVASTTLTLDQHPPLSKINI